MKEAIIMKYGVGVGLILLCLLIYTIFAFIVRRYKWGKKGIAIHIVLGVILVIAVELSAEYGAMAIKEFHVPYITAGTIDFLKVIGIGLVVLMTLFFLVNRLEEIQVERGAERTSARMIARLMKIAIFSLMMVLFGEHFGMSLSGLLTFGGVGGIAIGLASKDVLTNFFSGIMLYFDRPFKIGDWINSPDRQIEGTVVEVGWRITKIMTFDHRPLYVPNAAFSSISVENPGRMTNRRIKTEIGLRYEDADKMGAIVSDIRASLKNNPKIDTTQTLLVYFDAFADSSLNIMIYCFTKTVKWADWLEAQQEVYLDMIEIVHAHGADFAFPSQTLYVNNDQKSFSVDLQRSGTSASAPNPNLNVKDADVTASSTGV